MFEVWCVGGIGWDIRYKYIGGEYWVRYTSDVKLYIGANTLVVHWSFLMWLWGLTTEGLRTRLRKSPSREVESVKLKLVEDYQQTTIPLTSCVLVLLTYLLSGGAIFSAWEDWTFLDGAYFCFVSLMTIGFGDFGINLRDKLTLMLLFQFRATITSTTLTRTSAPVKRTPRLSSGLSIFSSEWDWLECASTSCRKKYFLR